jgi:hypothetical protein
MIDACATMMAKEPSVWSRWRADSRQRWLPAPILLALFLGPGSSHRGLPVSTPPTPPAASRATACAPTRCRSRSLRCARRWSCGWAYAGSSSAFVRRARPTSIRPPVSTHDGRRGCPRGPVVALARLLCDPAVSEAPDRDPSAPLATNNLETPNSNPSRSRPPPDCRLARPSTSTQALEPGSQDHVKEVGQQHTLRGWRPEEEPAT